jgi:Ca-activated chloride channel family protein
MQTSKKCASWSLATIVLLIVAAGGKALSAQSSGDATRPATQGSNNSRPELNLDIEIPNVEDDALHAKAPAANDSWPEVNLNVVVLDKQGAPQTVEVSGFQLFEDKSERPLHFRGSADSPVSLGLLIDASQSMDKRKPAVSAAVITIVKALPVGSEVTAVSFDEEAHLDLPFTPVSSADLSFLDHMNAHGGTALNDAVVVAEKYFAAHARFARRAMVLLSDGDDNASKLFLGDIMPSLQWPGAPMFYSLIVLDPEDSGAQARHARVAMELLANGGGGIAFLPKGKNFASAAAQLGDAIRSQYVLRFTAADPARDGKPRKLEVRLPAKDMRIHALPVYYAPAN